MRRMHRASELLRHLWKYSTNKVVVLFSYKFHAGVVNLECV